MTNLLASEAFVFPSSLVQRVMGCMLQEVAVISVDDVPNNADKVENSVLLQCITRHTMFIITIITARQNEILFFMLKQYLVSRTKSAVSWSLNVAEVHTGHYVTFGIFGCYLSTRHRFEREKKKKVLQCTWHCRIIIARFSNIVRNNAYSTRAVQRQLSLRLTVYISHDRWTNFPQPVLIPACLLS